MERWRVVADADPGVSFFISFDNGNSFGEVRSGNVIAIPGASDVALLAQVFDSSNTGRLVPQLPSNIYPASLQVEDGTTGITIPLAPGLVPSAPGVASLATKYICAAGTNLNLIPYIQATDAARTFNVAYTNGPAEVQVVIRAQIITENSAVTPVFRGVTLQEV